MKTGALIIFLPLILCGSLLSCGGGGSDNLQGSYGVNDVNILAKNIDVGEDVRVEVFFETKTEFDGTPDGVDLIVRVPADLEYVPGTSFIYDNSTDNTDARTPDNVEVCDDGSQLITYNFIDAELFERELGIGKFGLRFEARGARSSTTATVGARADGVFIPSCDEVFTAEEDETISVN